eukprot:jgi/Bigna1/82077/fgenesh1_pg.87_\
MEELRDFAEAIHDYQRENGMLDPLQIPEKARDRYERTKSLCHRYYKKFEKGDLGANVKLADGEKALFDKAGSDSTYGEIAFDGVYQLLQHEEKDGKRLFKTEKAVLFDLGSGVGFPVLAALLICPELASATGVELSLARHKEAERIRNSISESDIRTKMHYLNEDIMNVELGKADIIWLSSLMFPHPLILRICEKFDTELHQGCYVVSSRRLNTSKRLKFIKTKKVIMSWNTGHVVYCYIAMYRQQPNAKG